MKRRFNYKDREKGSCYSRDPYGLPKDQWPESLKTEFAQYEHWRTESYVAGRPRKYRQRESTFQKGLREFEAYFGYLVNVAEYDVGSLCLAHVGDPTLLRAYASWHIKNRTDGNPSRFVQKTLNGFLVVSRHYLKVEGATLQAIVTLKNEMAPDPVRDKRERWNSLITLEQVGLAEYPDGSVSDPVQAALAVQRSLVIRLLVRRPLRSRNIREMELGRNLFREDNRWTIAFQGVELKVACRKGRENIYRLPFPGCLTELLEEFLEKQRPILNVNDLPNVFVSPKGLVFSPHTLNSFIKKAIYEYTGKATNIHLFRDIWATEYLRQTQDFLTAAEILGDRIETVLAHYAHLRIESAGQAADDFLDRMLRQLSPDSQVASPSTWTVHPIYPPSGRTPLYVAFPADGGNGFLLGEMQEIIALRDALDRLIKSDEHDSEISLPNERFGWPWPSMGEVAREILGFCEDQGNGRSKL
jgi:hypothetical protein